MQSFMFALNAILPIILMVVLGYIIKKIGLVKKDNSKLLNKLVFRLFLPVMLFLNVYNIELSDGIDYRYIGYAFLATVTIYLLCIPIVMLITSKNERRGAILQATFRSNYALIGIPLAESLFGAEGTITATVLLAVIVPVFNVLAVVSLSIFKRDTQKPNVIKIILDIIKNPLIISIALGGLALLVRMLFVKYSIDFRISEVKPMFKVLNYLSSVATPIALLVLGIQFEFSAVKELRKEIFFGVLIRNLIVPLLGLGVAYLLFKDMFGGAHFAAFVAMFSTPVSVSSVPMAQEMDSDVALAGQLVIWTTVISAFSIFFASFILKAVGIF